MTKDEAIVAMRNGQRVAHRHFTPDEWMEQIGLYYQFEDGCQCEHDEFWRFRTEESWEDGWRIV